MAQIASRTLSRLAPSAVTRKWAHTWPRLESTHNSHITIPCPVPEKSLSTKCLHSPAKPLTTQYHRDRRGRSYKEHVGHSQYAMSCVSYFRSDHAAVPFTFGANQTLSFASSRCTCIVHVRRRSNINAEQFVTERHWRSSFACIFETPLVFAACSVGDPKKKNKSKRREPSKASPLTKELHGESCARNRIIDRSSGPERKR